jgi:hypothetical protein
MKNISKLLVGILFSALVIAPSYAGELAVSGGATATYATNGDDMSAGKNLGISNELDFTASGELDNGYTWKYQVQLDGSTASNDDTRLEIGTNMGTIGLYVSEGGISSELAHGVGALGTGFDYVSPTSFTTGYDVDGYSNIQYHTPADLLPFGLAAKVGYVPNTNASSTAQLSAKESAPVTTKNLGGSLEMIQLKAAPIDGLSIQGSAARTDNQTGDQTANEEGVSANLGAKYTMGPVSVGYTEGGNQTAVASGEITYYENKFYGFQYDVNDALSLSYNVDESDKNVRSAVAVAATAGTKVVTGMEQKSYQVAYTTGGATIGIAQVEVSNSDYTVGKTEEQTVISLGISF